MYLTFKFQLEGTESSDDSLRGDREGAQPTWKPEGGGEGEARARARLDAGGAHAGLLGGSPLTLLQGIIPGKWGFSCRKAPRTTVRFSP